MTRAALAPFWPAAMRLDQAAAYCGLSVDVFKDQCPVKPAMLAPGAERYLTVRLQDWLDYYEDPNNSGVYFIRSGSFVKIGFSVHIPSRFAELQCANPLEMTLVHCIPGTMRDERAQHKRFKKQHYRGEWFRLEGELLEFLTENSGETSE